ncbi:MAG: ATP-binding protein [Nitrospira sp.]
MTRWHLDLSSTLSRRAIVGLIIALALGMVPLTLFSTELWQLLGIGGVGLIPLLGLLYWAHRRQSTEEVESAQARRALEANEARLRKMVDIALDAVITIDGRGIVTGWNPQAERIFGWTSQEALGHSLTTTIIPPQYRDAHERGLRQFFKTGHGPVLNKRIEIVALHRSGREFPVELAITPVHLDDQTIFSAFLRDITDRKQAENELRRTQAAAESSNRAKTEFLANMSHELRTPLNAIIGTSDLLLKTSLTPDQRQCALMSQRASQALLRLVNDVLDMAKIEAGTLRIERAPFDLKDLLDRISRLVGLRQQGKAVDLSFIVERDVPTQLVGDGLRLQQILLNLVGNALKFTEHGSITLAVSPAQAENGQARLQFTVRDTGIGIPVERLEHIFERFTQVDSGDTRKYGGAGLGLSICKQLVELMGGTIQVSSEVGVGTTFRATIPFSLATPDDASVPAADAPVVAATVDAPRSTEVPLTILLVDDSSETGQLASLYLKSTPHRLSLAPDGPSAIQQCQTRRFHLVFLDLQMPGMDGYTTVAAIRAWERTQGAPPMPIVALTADVLGQARERSLQAGCTGFIGKPFSQEAFLQAIRRHSSPQADSPMLSENRRRELRSGQPDDRDFDELRRKFLTNRWKDLTTLASAIAMQDWTTIQTIGHRIKGLAGSYGLAEIGSIGGLIEDAARLRQMDRIESEREQLKRVLERLDPSRDQAA